jgi:hypothetical protein
MADIPKTPARLAAILFGLLAVAWTAFVFVRFGGSHQAIAGAIACIALGLMLFGIWAEKSLLVFSSGFVLFAAALGVGYYLGLFLLPAMAFCWAAGMAAGYASQAAVDARKTERILGWGLFAAMLAYTGFLFTLSRSVAPHDVKSSVKMLTPSTP